MFIVRLVNPLTYEFSNELLAGNNNASLINQMIHYLKGTLRFGTMELGNPTTTIASNWELRIRCTDTRSIQANARKLMKVAYFDIDLI